MKKTFNPIAAEQFNNLFNQLADSNANMANYSKFEQEAKEQGDDQMATYWKSQWRRALSTGSDILTEIDAMRETFEPCELRGEL